MHNKLPAIQFYPSDWRGDVGVQSLSYHDRGVWLEILFLMHSSEVRGKLLLNGKPMPNEVLARLLGLDKQKLEQTLENLLNYGVASIDDETGALMNRRMVKDEHIRQVRKEAGAKGGNPNLVNQIPNQNASKTQAKRKQNSTPSSSSSISLKEKDKTNVLSKKKTLISLPDDFTLSDKMREWAAENTPSANIELETENFLDHHAAKGSKFADWTAAWRTWMRNTKKFGGGKNGNAPTAPPPNFPPVPENRNDEMIARGFPVIETVH